MKKELRQKMVLKRKNFLPTLVVSFILLISLIIIVYFSEPTGSFIFLFFLTLFIFLFLISSLILANSKHGLILTSLTVIFLILRMYGVGNILNAILLAALGIIAIIYSKHR